MTERTIQMLQILEKEGYGISDLKNLITEFDSYTATLTSGTEKSTEKRVSKILKDIGMQPNILGYHYCKEAICMLYKKEVTVGEGMAKSVYQKVAKKYDSTDLRVERAMRHAVEKVFNKSNPDDIYEFFGRNSYYMKGKPTNFEFITSIVEYMQMEDL